MTAACRILHLAHGGGGVDFQKTKQCAGTSFTEILGCWGFRKSLHKSIYALQYMHTSQRVVGGSAVHVQ